jgi:hypothetical protein
MSNEFDVKVSYKGMDRKNKAIQLSDILDIQEERLTEHFAEQASIFGYFAIQLAEADRLLGKIKTEAEQEYAKADAHYRKTYNELEEKFTEAVIRGDVMLDEDYNKVLDRQRLLQRNVSTLKAIVNALKMKADMLISMGAHLRQEYGMTGMTIREQDMDKAVDDVKKTIKHSRGD